MLVASIARGILIILIGIVLYSCLIYAFRKGDKVRLRKTRHPFSVYYKISKFKIILIYIIILISGTALLFLSIMDLQLSN